MNCETITDRLYDLHFDLLEDEERRAIDAHLADCEACRQAYEQVRRECGLLERWAPPAPPEGLAKKTIDAVRSASGSRATTYAPVEPEMRWLGSRRFWTIAASLFIFILAGVGLKTLHVVSRHASPAEVFLYGQSELTPGLPASFRVYARNGRNRHPIPGADVRVVLASATGDQLTIARAKTDENGFVQASPDLPDDLAEGDYTLEVKLDSRAGRSQVSRRLAVKRSFRTMVSTDKPLYQPGQTIHIRALTLATADLRPASTRDAVIEVHDSKGNKVFKKRLTTSGYGIVSADLELADQVNTGDYTIVATVGDTTSERSVTVSRYTLPKFKIELSTDRGYYLPGEKVVADLRAEYTFGEPVAGAEVRVTADEFVEQFRTFATVDGTTDREGCFHFEMQLRDSFVGQDLKKGDAIVKLEATVKDKADHVQKKAVDLTVTQSPIRIEVFPESGELVQNVENVLYLVTAYPDGRPAKTRLTVGRDRQQVESSDVGIAKVKITPTTPQLQLTVLAEDAQGVRAQVTRSLRVGVRSDAFLLRTDRAVYRSGETAEIEVWSATRVCRVFLDVVKDRRTVLMKAIDVQGGRGALALDLPPDLFGTLELHAYRVMTDGNLVRDTKVIQVTRVDDLKVAAELDKDTYRPGETALLRFLVQQRNGTPTQAALSLAGVDEAVFALHDMRPGLEQIYFTLQEEILKPRYELCAHAPISPAQAVVPLPEPEPELEEAKVVLFSAAEGASGVGRGAGQSFAERQNVIRYENRRYFRALGTAAVLTPFILFVLATLPLLLYAVVRLFARKPIEGASEADLAVLRRRSRRLMWGWVLALYLPPLTGLVGAAVSAPFGAIAMLFTTLPMLCLLIALTRDARRCRAAEAFPGMRRAISCVPWAYPLAGLAILCIVSGVGHWPRGGIDGEVAFALALVMGCIAAFLVGALSVARNCALRPVCKTEWAWLMVSRPLFAALPVLLLSMDCYLPVLGGVGRTIARGAFRGRALAPFIYPVFDSLPMAKQGLAVVVETSLEDGDWAARYSDSGYMFGNKYYLGTKAEDTGTAAAPRKLKAPTRIRRDFPETLLWRPELITDAAGRAELRVPLADSITTWRVAMSAVSGTGQMGSGAKGIRVFQDFFVDIDFPVALTQNDEVSVPVAVYNYLDKPQVVRLEAQAESWCEMLDGTARELQIGPKDITSVYFPLRALKPGRHSLTIKAFGSEMADAVQREATVTPDGRPVTQTINGRLDENLDRELLIPAEAIDGSTDLFVKIYPGAFSQVVEGMDSIFRMPYGCFEQTSSTTYPNVLVLDYLRRTKQAKPDVELKALNYINLGYQRLLSYEVDGGGFDWYGNPPAHNILTAYGLMEFHDMSKVYEVDPAVIRRTREWLCAQQKSDGTWEASYSNIAQTANGRLQNPTLRTTAYVAWALAEAAERDSPLDRALAYVRAECRDEKDPYTLALCANAFIASDHAGDAAAILSRLSETGIVEKEMVHWSSTAQGVTYSRGNSLDIETTALIAYAMLKAKRHTELAHKALAWLVERKDSNGTWHSTQATVHAMRALLAGTGAGGAVDEDLHVTIAANGKLAREITITPDTSDVFRLIDLRPHVRKGRNVVALETSGKGNLAYQIVATHYVPWSGAGTQPRPEEPLTIDVEYDAASVKKDDLLTCRVAVRYNRPGSAPMTIVDLGIPPGFAVQTQAFQRLKEQGLIDRYSLTGRQIILYIRAIESGVSLQFSYRLRAKFPIRAKTPASMVYQYYQPEVRGQAAPVVLTVL